MSVKVSELDLASDVVGANELEINNAGTSKKINAAQMLNYIGATSTGWLSGGVVSINADNSKFDYTDGVGVIVDASDPTAITSTKVSWTGDTALTPAFLATQGFTFFAIDINGDLVQSATFPVGGNLRQYIQIGGVSHGNNINIDAASIFKSATPFQIAPSLTDLMIAIGVINTSGNVFSGASAGNLKFDKTVGSAFYFGIEVDDPEDENNKVTPALASPTILFSWRDGSGGFNTTTSDAIIAGVFDNDSGGDANGPDGVVTTNNWINAKIQYSPDLEQVIIQYGTTTFGTSSAAIAGILTDSFGNNPSFGGVPIRAYVALRGAALDMTDSGDAVFTQANKFGLI